MRIDLNHGPQDVPESSQASAQTTNSANSASTPSAPGALGALGEDQAQLSGAHVQVQALAAQAARLPEVREERVTALRQAVASGQYEASPEKTAGALIVHMVAGPAA